MLRLERGLGGGLWLGRRCELQLPVMLESLSQVFYRLELLSCVLITLDNEEKAKTSGSL